MSCRDSLSFRVYLQLTRSLTSFLLLRDIIEFPRLSFRCRKPPFFLGQKLGVGITFLDLFI